MTIETWILVVAFMLAVHLPWVTVLLMRHYRVESKIRARLEAAFYGPPVELEAVGRPVFHPGTLEAGMIHTEADVAAFLRGEDCPACGYESSNKPLRAVPHA